MKKREYLDYLEDMLDAIVALEDFVKGIDFTQFAQDKKTVFATVRCFEIIGEASKKIKGPTRTKHPEIPWEDMAGMRDKLIHGYFGVDTKVLWDSIQSDIPQLKVAVSEVIRELKSESQ